MMVGKTVEIRSHLTLNLSTTLQHPKITAITGQLTYSPDGCSLACTSYTAVLIWDIQTGGVMKEIKCTTEGILLAWSSDGRMICTIDQSLSVHIYDTTLGMALSPGGLRSGGKPRLWAYKESFCAITRTKIYDSLMDTVEVFKVGYTLTKIHAFDIGSDSTEISISPTTCHVFISDGHKFRIFEDWNSDCLLEEEGLPSSHCFSSDGILFVAIIGGDACIWKYTSGHYKLQKKFQYQGSVNDHIQFSPNLSSILEHFGGVLQVWHLDSPPITKPYSLQFAGLSGSGNQIVTANQLDTAVTITNIHSQVPSQFIETGIEIEGFALTGKVLLVAGRGVVVAWLLTAEGLVDGVLDGGRASPSNSIWCIKHPQPFFPTFKVGGQVGVIRFNNDLGCTYHTETGEFLPIPQYFDSPWDPLCSQLHGQKYLHYHNFPQQNTLPEHSWQTSKATLKGGWAKDPEGKHRLWVPVKWREGWSLEDWCYDITTQFSIIEQEPIVVKF
jgi:hypothetical protein